MCSREGPRQVARAGDGLFERELDETVLRYWSLETAQAEVTTGSTQSSAVELAGTSPATLSGHAAILVRVDHLRDGLRSLQGVLVLDLGPSPRPLRVGLAEVGALMAERASAR